jgi:hypothetical protein
MQVVCDCAMRVSGMGVIARREEREGGHGAMRHQVLLGSSWNPAVFQYSRKAAGQIRGSSSRLLTSWSYSRLLEGCLPPGSKCHCTSCLELQSGKCHLVWEELQTTQSPGSQGPSYMGSAALFYTLSWCMPVTLPRSGPHVAIDLQKLTWARLTFTDAMLGSRLFQCSGLGM